MLELKRSLVAVRGLQIRKLLFQLEFHEILSLLMLAILSALYRFGLKGETLADEIVRIALTAGPITKSILLLMVLFLCATLFVRNQWIRTQAKLLWRIMASFLVMLFSFEAVVHYIHARGLPLQDEMLQKWDNAIFFGKQPAVWLEPVSYHPLTLFFSAVYLAWFALTYGSIFLMWWYGRKALLEYTTAVLLTFYTGYLIYICVPAIGPIFTYTYSTPLGGLTALMLEKKVFAPAADVFPSLHTGISVAMFLLTWKYGGRWFWFYAPITTAIILSTIYLRIHYGVDVIAGIILAVITTWLSKRILTLWEKLGK